MAKVGIASAGAAAIESALRTAMPELHESLRAIRNDLRALRVEMHNEIRTLDAKVDSLRDEMLDRFERATALVNEVAHRVTRVEGKLEGYMEAMRGVVLPAQASRRRRAG